MVQLWFLVMVLQTSTFSIVCTCVSFSLSSFCLNFSSFANFFASFSNCLAVFGGPSPWPDSFSCPSTFPLTMHTLSDIFHRYGLLTSTRQIAEPLTCTPPSNKRLVTSPHGQWRKQLTADVTCTVNDETPHHTNLVVWWLDSGRVTPIADEMISYTEITRNIIDLWNPKILTK